MACKPCAERRKALREKLLAKTKARKHVQAAAISAVLVASETVGKVLGIGEDTEDGTVADQDSGGRSEVHGG